MSRVYESLRVIPRYLKGKSPDELQALMLKNNIESGVTFHYFDIQNDGKAWFAWFLKDSTDLIREQADGITK